MTVNEVHFDNKFWCSVKNKFQKYHGYFFKVCSKMGKVLHLSWYFNSLLSNKTIDKYDFQKNYHDCLIIECP